MKSIFESCKGAFRRHLGKSKKYVWRMPAGYVASTQGVPEDEELPING